jgi:hypothetical protein
MITVSACTEAHFVHMKSKNKGRFSNHPGFPERSRKVDENIPQVSP